MAMSTGTTVLSVTVLDFHASLDLHITTHAQNYYFPGSIFEFLSMF